MSRTLILPRLSSWLFLTFSRYSFIRVLLIQLLKFLMWMILLSFLPSLPLSCGLELRFALYQGVASNKN